MKMTGNTMLVTGGGSGIGRELAQRFHALGNRVLVAGRTRETLEETIAGSEDMHALTFDASDTASIEQLAADVLARFPTLNVLINNAGIIGPELARQSGVEMDFAGFLTTLDVNTLGPLRVTQALLPNLRAAGGAKVAVVSSRMGQLDPGDFGGTSGFVAYRASKAAVNKVFQCLAADLRGEGIAVAMLHPGYVRTDMGGAGADIEPAESAGGIRKVLAALDLASTGRFRAYDGTALAW